MEETHPLPAGRPCCICTFPGQGSRQGNAASGWSRRLCANGQQQGRPPLVGVRTRMPHCRHALPGMAQQPCSSGPAAPAGPSAPRTRPCSHFSAAAAP